MVIPYQSLKEVIKAAVHTFSKFNSINVSFQIAFLLLLFQTSQFEPFLFKHHSAHVPPVSLLKRLISFHFAFLGQQTYDFLTLPAPYFQPLTLMDLLVRHPLKFVFSITAKAKTASNHVPISTDKSLWKDFRSVRLNMSLAENDGICFSFRHRWLSDFCVHVWGCFVHGRTPHDIFSPCRYASLCPESRKGISENLRLSAFWGRL